jgi:predicted peroxiredoxin
MPSISSDIEKQQYPFQTLNTQFTNATEGGVQIEHCNQSVAANISY